jgi:Glycosyl transferase family 2
MLISVVMPTIPGRETIYSRCARTYLELERADRETADVTLEFITEQDHPTVGSAWQAGADKATGDYIHLTNDDCEPRPGWWRPAVEACDAGFLPSPMVYAPDGTPQGLPQWGKIAEDWTPVTCAMIPFLSRKQWEQVQPLLLTHYHSDNWVTWRAGQGGWPCRLRTGYAFTHHWAQPGRGAGMSEGDRMAHDERLYHQALLMAQAGQWVKPWPPGGTLG